MFTWTIVLSLYWVMNSCFTLNYVFKLKSIVLQLIFARSFKQLHNFLNFLNISSFILSIIIKRVVKWRKLKLVKKNTADRKWHTNAYQGFDYLSEKLTWYAIKDLSPSDPAFQFPQVKLWEVDSTHSMENPLWSGWFKFYRVNYTHITPLYPVFQFANVSREINNLYEMRLDKNSFSSFKTLKLAAANLMKASKFQKYKIYKGKSAANFLAGQPKPNASPRTL